MTSSKALVATNTAAHFGCGLSKLKSATSSKTMQTVWKSILRRIPLIVHLNLKFSFPDPDKYHPISMNAVSTLLVDTDNYLHDSRKSTNSALFVTNPDPESDWEWSYEPEDPPAAVAPKPRTPVVPSTTQIAHILMDTDELTPEHEDTLNLLTRAGFVAQEARGQHKASSLNPMPSYTHGMPFDMYYR